MDPDEITPPEFRNNSAQRDEAAEIIRAKLNAIYKIEPDAVEEIQEVFELEDHHAHLSKHQKLMKELTESDRDVAEIQTAWHEYYQNLSEPEKHEVWQEFYAEHEKKRAEEKTKAKATEKAEPVQAQPQPRQPRPADERTRPKAKKHLVAEVVDRIPLPKGLSASTEHIKKLSKNHHARSLGFGLSMGALVIFIMMFSFFNERIIVPFIRPSQNVSATPIIVDPSSDGKAGPDPKIIIPKINIEAPVVYDVPSLDEKEIQTGLERGIVHYPNTPNPGEAGNSVMFGHSSGNIINKGKYKFAFLLLKSLEKDDTFIVENGGKRYVYKIYNKFVTTPTDFAVIQPQSLPATMTLITCDPPGTSTNRLIVQAEQIFPDPSGNTAPTANATPAETPKALPSNSPSLWHRIFN